MIPKNTKLCKIIAIFLTVVLLFSLKGFDELDDAAEESMQSSLFVHE